MFILDTNYRHSEICDTSLSLNVFIYQPVVGIPFDRYSADKSVNLSLMCSIAIPNDPSILNFLSNLFNSGFCKSTSRDVESGWKREHNKNEMK